MATAVWDLGRREVGPAAGPARRVERRVPARVRRRMTAVIAFGMGAGLLSALPSALDLMRLAPAVGQEVREVEQAPESAPPIRAVVAPGDTVWELAAPHVPEGGDLQSYVAEVVLLNRIDPGALEPGSVLDLPRH